MGATETDPAFLSPTVAENPLVNMAEQPTTTEKKILDEEAQTEPAECAVPVVLQNQSKQRNNTKRNLLIAIPAAAIPALCIVIVFLVISNKKQQQNFQDALFEAYSVPEQEHQLQNPEIQLQFPVSRTEYR